MHNSAETPIRMRHVWVVLSVLLVVGIAYAKVTAAYYCSYDDHIEIHRAAFEDTREPSHVFTTAHFLHMYRPLNRGANLVTYWVGNGSPIFFRVRNLAFHLVNVGLVYLLGWLLFRSIYVSVVAAAVFGLHPLANQSVIGAVFTNTMAHAGLLAGIAMFIIAVRSASWQLWLTAGLISGWLGLMSYDSNIVAFGIMATYLVVCVMLPARRLVVGRFVVAFLLITGLLVSSYFLMRSLFVPSAWARASALIPPPATLGQNLIMYTSALLSPIDPVLANEWLATPLPSEIQISRSAAIFIGGVVIIVFVILSFAIGRWMKRKSLNIDWATVVFLLCGIAAPLTPVLVFRPHPSETYLYVSVAFYALLLSYAVIGVLVPALGPNSKAVVIGIVILFTGVFGTATWVRNARVARCGEIARRVLENLPKDLLAAGAWNVTFANAPGEEATRRYGFYGFRGVDTIGHGDGASVGITSALRWVYKNDSLTGEVVQAQKLNNSGCHRTPQVGRICVLVHADGRTERFAP